MDSEDYCYECGADLEMNYAMLIYPQTLPNGAIGQMMCSKCFSTMGDIFELYED